MAPQAATTPTTSPPVSAPSTSSVLSTPTAAVTPTSLPSTTIPAPSSSAPPLTCSAGSTSSSTWQNSVATPVCVAVSAVGVQPSTSTSTFAAKASDVPVNGTIPLSSTLHETPTASAGPKNNMSSNGLGGGAVAGVAIACLVGGAAIAAAILFFFFRRKKNSQAYAYSHSPSGENSGGFPSPEKGPLVAASAISSNVDNFLPQPLEDDAITQELSKIRDNLKNHVRSYYHHDPIRAGSFDTSALSGLATATGIHTSVLATLLSDVSSRIEGIRVFLAWVVLSKCDGSTLPSLLPDDLSGTAVAVQNKEGANIALVSKWKAITGALLQQQPKSSSRAIAGAINEANAVLAPFVRSSVDGAQRQKNLEMILSRAAGLAFMLFSQPGSYRFDFAGSGDSLVTFPALLQIIGDDARTLSPPRVLWKREVDA